MTLTLLFIQLALALLMNAALLYIFYQLIKLHRGEAPYVPSTNVFLETIIERSLLPKEGVIIDLGAGDGKALRAFARAGYEGPLIGYEYAWLPYVLGRMRNFKYRDRITIHRKRFEHADIRVAKGVYVYLLEGVLKSLVPKLASELVPGTRVIAPSFQIAGWIPTETHEVVGLGGRPTNIYVYDR